MKVTVIEHKRISNIDISLAVTVETEMGELTKEEVMVMVQILMEDENNETEKTNLLE